MKLDRSVAYNSFYTYICNVNQLREMAFDHKMKPMSFLARFEKKEARTYNPHNAEC